MSNDQEVKAFITYCLRMLRRSPIYWTTMEDDLEYERLSMYVEDAELILERLKEHLRKNPDTPQIAMLRKHARNAVDAYVMDCDDQHYNFHSFLHINGYSNMEDQFGEDGRKYAWILAQEWDAVTGHSASKTYTIPTEHIWRYTTNGHLLQ